MIRTVECVKGEHLTCAKVWHERHVCNCPCHDPELLAEVLDALEREGYDVETCDDHVIEEALAGALSILEAKALEAPGQV